MLDEFYSHYIWNGHSQDLLGESAARYVENVDSDPVVLFEGFTKNWRYPGWRVTWTVGPAASLRQWLRQAPISTAADRSHCSAAVSLLTEEHVRAETRAITEVFSKKRSLLIERLSRLGVRIDIEPQGTFYVWGDLAGLPEPYSEGMGFFREALKQRVIVVPGEFFDVNPGKRRGPHRSRFRRHARFSFGPSLETLNLACDRWTRCWQQTHEPQPYPGCRGLERGSANCVTEGDRAIAQLPFLAGVRPA